MPGRRRSSRPRPRSSARTSVCCAAQKPRMPSQSSHPAARHQPERCAPRECHRSRRSRCGQRPGGTALFRVGRIARRGGGLAGRRPAAGGSGGRDRPGRSDRPPQACGRMRIARTGAGQSRAGAPRRDQRGGAGRGVERERAHLDAALARGRQQISVQKAVNSGAASRILDAHLELLADPELIDLAVAGLAGDAVPDTPGGRPIRATPSASRRSQVRCCASAPAMFGTSAAGCSDYWPA